MKRVIIRISSIALLPILLLSCEMEKPMVEDALVKAPEIRASLGNETKTVLSTDAQGNGTISWLPGEEINVFFNTTGIAYTSTNTDTVTETTFTTDANVSLSELESGNVWGLYPFDASAQCDGSSITTHLPNEQSGVAGTFDTCFYPLLAHSSMTDLTFYNVCGGIKFSLARDDIYKIVLRGNADEALAGRVRLSLASGGKPKAEVISGDSSIILTPKDGATFHKDKDYYIICVPVDLPKGFQMDFYSVTGKKATYKKDGHFSIKRAVFSRKEHIDENIDEWTDNLDMTGGKRSGLYLGITGFNQDLYTYPITRLNEVTITDFNSFVNGLQMKNGSLLCYGVDQSINRLKDAVFPDDLCTVALVTFTDGLDQGSVMLNPAYGSEDSYLNAIQSRIQDENIFNHHITAYSVGLKGSDVSDVVKFRYNLQKLASSSDNAFEANNMSEVNSRLQAIAKKVTAISYIYDFSITIPGQSDKTLVRFTFDNVSNAANSSVYIEGTFHLSDCSLHDVTYHGLSSASGSVIRGKVDGIFVTFSFDTVTVDNGKDLSPSSISQWAYVSSTGKWQVNSEFNANQNIDIEVTKQSVAVMLVLDCSSSLGNQYSTMQSHARSFIRTLQEASYDPYAVSSVRLNQSNRTVYIGESFQLTPTVSPSTARDKSVLWTTTNPEVALVDQDGMVTGLAAGNAVIMVTTFDGGYTASCSVTVKPVMVTGINLDKTSISLNEGEEISLTATTSPTNATDKTVTWTSSNETVAIVDQNGKITAKSKGNTTIKVTANDGSGVSASCSVIVYRIDVPQAVDMGIVVNGKNIKWASFNLGASSPEEYGLHYAWGETEPKSDYSWSTYKFGTSDDGPFSKYNTRSWYGTVDNKTVLDPEDDVAHVKLGGNWRMPTDAEWAALEGHSTWTWINNYNDTGVSGMIVTSEVEGLTDQSIFLPTTGYRFDTSLYSTGFGNYWSSSLCIDQPYNAWFLYFYSGKRALSANPDRPTGRAIRPVLISEAVESITLSQASLVMHVGESFTLIASVNPTYALDKSIIWTSSDESVATVDQTGKVTAVSKGTTTIKATANYGSGVSGACEVEVQQYVTSISLDKTSLTLIEGESSTISVSSVLPYDANDKSVVWSSSDEAIATVDQIGTITGVSKGTATITATAADGSGKYASCIIKVRRYPAPDGAVDLGLSVLWATYNVGANKPEEYGEYFAWGETQPKSDYSWSTYKWCNGNYYNLTKYSGSPDDKLALDPEDDAASANWGGSWRMPTDAEWEELMSNCTWTWTDDYNGTCIKGNIVTSGKAGYTDKSIFLPAAGWRDNADLKEFGSIGYYWGPSLHPANTLTAIIHGFGDNIDVSGMSYRYYGLSIRPVTE